MHRQICCNIYKIDQFCGLEEIFRSFFGDDFGIFVNESDHG